MRRKYIFYTQVLFFFSLLEGMRVRHDRFVPEEDPCYSQSSMMALGTFLHTVTIIFTRIIHFLIFVSISRICFFIDDSDREDIRSSSENDSESDERESDDGEECDTSTSYSESVPVQVQGRHIVELGVLAEELDKGFVTSEMLYMYFIHYHIYMPAFKNLGVLC